MKQIQTINIWKDGQQKKANYFYLKVIYDDLKNYATFYYSLNEFEESSIITDGNITISGEEYDLWGSSEDINNEAFNMVANKLNIQIISTDTGVSGF